MEAMKLKILRAKEPTVKGVKANIKYKKQGHYARNYRQN
jgi:hypothetical protein